MKKVFRSIQTLFPILHDARFSLKMMMIGITKNPHEEDFNALKLFKPKDDQVFIDIGSNRGEAISSMLATSKTAIKIIGFEPNPLIFDKLKSQFTKYKFVEVHNCGLGDLNNDLTLYIPFYRKWMFDGLSSFKLKEAEDWLETRLWRFDKTKLSIKEVDCQIRKLDDFKLNPYFIKIDVQGFELEALQGGISTIGEYKPILLIESITDEVMKFLGQFGYKFYKFNKGKLTNGIGELNTYCITEEVAADIL